MNILTDSKNFKNAGFTTLVTILGLILVIPVLARQPLPAEALPLTAQPKIQLAILLDTSSSMDGLIDQTRNQLWQVVNEFSQSKRNGVSPILEVAVYEYGNDNLSSENGYIRQVSPLTRELDQISEAIFSLTTNGGSEYCGYVIDSAVKNLQWSQSDNDIKVIFIAGNEPFSQGPTPFSEAISRAKAKGVTINTIHAGSYDEGVSEGWQQGALLAGGNYMSIDHNQQIAHIVAPQDQRIAELNQELNKTYVPYGATGAEKAERQQAQDDNNAGISISLLAKRVQSKVSSFYNNAKWDLVDAFNSGEVELNALTEEELPAPMRSMSDEDKVAYIKQNAEQRQKIKSEILELSKERDEFVTEQKRSAAKPTAPTIEEAVVSSVREIGKNKGFSFK
ncbi:MAG: VWA domain-containing protein [Gammaproteobacteria bacterium]|nr:VWA domain-containing protein [Gammaproteobacteria bacterium]